MKYYSYIFVRQDISVEQQMVQVGHASMQMGYYLPSKSLESPHAPNGPEDTHFVLVGVRNEDALLAARDILDAFGFVYEIFIESYPKDNMTAIATYPIKENCKGVLKAFNLLKLG